MIIQKPTKKELQKLIKLAHSEIEKWSVFLKEVENGEIIVVDREGISRDSLGKEQES